MSHADPFTLSIFVADGNPEGLRIVERRNWSGKAVVFPRSLFPQVRGRSELNQTGVYLLIGPRPGTEENMLYIGEGDPVLDRLDSHYKGKDFWRTAIFFIAGAAQLNKAHVQYLEARLIRLAQTANRWKLDNAKNETEPTLSESDTADMEVFLRNLLSTVGVLGIQAFEQVAAPRPSEGAVELIYRNGEIEARAFDTPQGFIIKKGSQAVLVDQPSFARNWPGYAQKKKELVESGVLAKDGKHFIFTQDYPFTSRSSASACIRGNSSGGGKSDWRDRDGRTLSEIEEAATKK